MVELGTSMLYSCVMAGGGGTLVSVFAIQKKRVTAAAVAARTESVIRSDLFMKRFVGTTVKVSFAQRVCEVIYTGNT